MEYRILVIDDEPLARLSIRKIIGTGFPGFVICGEAGTGPDGLRLYRELKPDIVLMDIQIPDLNGLETSKLIFDIDPEAQILILSAYDQFEYAQDAINQGVLGYILKPLQEKKLRIHLDHAVERIDALHETARSKNQLETFKDIAQGDMVSSFIYGSFSGFSAAFYASHMEPPVESGSFVLFRLSGRPSAESQSQIRRYLKHFSDCFPGRWIGGIFPVFIRGESDRELIAGIARKLELLHNCPVETGTGSFRTSAADFPLSFSDALGSLDNEQTGQEERSYPRQMEEQFFSALSREGWTAAKKEMDGLLDYMELKNRTVSSLRTDLLELIIQIRRYFEDRGVTGWVKVLVNMISYLPLYEQKQELMDWARATIGDSIRLWEEEDRGEDLHIRKILKYIDLNDFNEISLERVSEAIGLTPQYVSRIFKDRYNMNFIEYLISRRMNLATKLLKETNLNIREIALRTGYLDVNYFSRVFRKHSGMAPRTFRLKADRV